jgi:hypothetical protein
VALLATVVDWSAIGKVVVGSLIATVGVTVAFSITIFGSVRFSELRRDERTIEAGLFGGLTLLATAAWIGAVVFGVIVMTSK